jgi:sugar lactone lactonase YvrE
MARRNLLTGALALLSFLPGTRAFAQSPSYTFQTLAGVAPSPPFESTYGLAVDGAGVMYVYADCAVWTVTTEGQVSLLAGKQNDCARTDGAGRGARLLKGVGIAIDASGTIYVLDPSSVRRITPDGVVATLAATGNFNFIAVDPGGTVYVADDHTVSTITPQGSLRVLAGAPGPSGSTDGVGTAARFHSIVSLAADAGAVYVSDNQAIRKVTPDGTVTTLAGTPGAEGFADGAGAAARFHWPWPIATDGSGNVYVGDYCTIRAVSASGVVTTLAGTPGTCGSTDGVGAEAVLSYGAMAMAASADGTVSFVQFRSLRRMTPDRAVTTLIGWNKSPGTIDGQGNAARFTLPADLALRQGTMYAAQQDYLTQPAQPDWNATVRAVSAGGFTRSLRQPSREFFSLTELNWRAAGVAVDTGGTVYVTRSCGIVKSDVAAGWLPVAGSQIRMWGVQTYVGIYPSTCGLVDASGSDARFSSPHGIAVDATGTLYVADTGNYVVRKITTDGTVTTLAGLAGSQGSDDGAGSAARFAGAWGIAIDTTGTLFVTDRSNHTIRRVTAQGIVSTIAGLAGSSGSADGVGSAARFNEPTGIAVGADGTLYVADTGNSTIRTIATDGSVSTIGGLAGAIGSTDGVGAAARFWAPEGITVDELGTVYVADTMNHTIRVGLSAAAEAPAITTQPQSAAVNAGEVAQFTVSAMGRPSPGYQWQQSTDGGGWWTDISNSAAYSGALTSTLTVTTGTAGVATRFRCLVDNVAGSTASDVVSLTVPGVTATPSVLYFNGAVPDFKTIFAITGPQDVSVSFVGAAGAWTATSDVPWLIVTGGSGTGAGRFTVSIDRNYPYLFLASLCGTITISAPMLNSSASVSVYFASRWGDRPVPLSLYTLGWFDTPVEGPTPLRGSFAVTGWALDTIGVDRVEIWRDLVDGETTTPYYGPGHPGDGKVFIANAFFVEGSRPDVEERFTSYPFAYRAGWGYLLLSQGLWNQGNGTYKLYAFAFSVDGRATTLGTKTITVDNANATQPFGAIDTPGYGATVSGSIWNYGWALTPASTQGCTITNGHAQMSVDSAPLVTVDYGAFRDDVAAAFPGLTNSSAAGGSYFLDTTQLTNGMHQIGWFVTDSCGRQDGVGSRFFTVLNGSGDQAAVTGAHVLGSGPGTYDARGARRDVKARRDGALRQAQGMASAGERAEMRADDLAPREDTLRRTVRVRQIGGDWETAARDATGGHAIHVEQTGRIEVQLPALASGEYAGFMDVRGGRRALPLGSSLDAAAGIFSWQPAPGFLGAYDLVFVSTATPDIVVRVRVSVGSLERVQLR